MPRIPSVVLPLALLTACSDVKEDDHHHDHNHGLTTALVLHFTDGTGTTSDFVWEDPEADGVDIQIDDVVLTAGVAYQLDVEVLNQLEEPVEDVTVEIQEEADQHQFFFTGDAVSGPASASDAAFLAHSYADTDAAGLPLGIENDISAVESGAGELVVTLRHLPTEGGSPTKTEGLAEVVAESGFGAIGGETDIQVTFPVFSE